MGATRFTIDATFKALDKFSGPVVRMTTKMDRFTRKIRKGMWGIGKMTKRVARNMRNLSLTLGSLAVLGGYALRGLLDPAVRFQHAMDGVNAVVLGAYTQHMPKLRKEALRLGAETTFTAVQVANAMEVLAKSGLAADDTFALIGPTLKGAEAAGSDISTMADILVSTIAQMKDLSPKDGTSVIDAYAVAASSANTTLEELGDGMKKVIPVGEALDFTFKDLLATTTLLQHMGIEASMSASQQRTFFTRLASLTPKAAKSFRRLGIDILKGDKSGDIKTLPNLLRAIAAGFNKIKGNRSQIQKMAEAVGLRGGIAGNILIRNMDQLDGILGKINTMSEGASEKMAKMRLDNLFGDLVRLKSAFMNFRIEMASDELPELRKLVQQLTEFFQKPENVKKFAGYLSDAVTGVQDFWHSNKTFLKEFTHVMWAVTKIAWAVIKGIGVMIVAIAKFFGKSFALADKLASIMPGEDAMNRWFASFAPDPTGEAYRTEAHLGAPWAPGEVSGVITVRAEQGTQAGVNRAHSKNKVRIEVDSVGSDPDLAMAVP